MTKPLLLGGPGSLEDSVYALSRALFRGDLTVDQVRTIPAQQLFFAIKQMGFESAGDILELVSKKQYQSLLDFELWTKDSFREDRFWEWLNVIDDPKNLEPIQRFLGSVDVTALAIIINRYIDVVYHDEPDDHPPGPNHYTPDKGSTWICIKTSNPERHRLIGKLLAFMYQTDLDFFYKLLNQAGQGTAIEFEEIGFKQKENRLLSENIPELEDAAALHEAISISDAETIIDEILKTQKVYKDDYVSALHPVLFFSAATYQPLLSCMESVSSERFSLFQLELGRLLNSAVVYLVKDFAEEGQLRLLTDQVFGVVNIGLQYAAERRPEVLSKEVLELLKLSDMYRLGLHVLYNLRSLASRVPEDVCDTLLHMNAPLRKLIATTARPMPAVPLFVREDGSFDLPEKEEDKFKIKAISSLETTRKLTVIIQQQVLDKLSDIRSYESQGKKHMLKKRTRDQGELQ